MTIVASSCSGSADAAVIASSNVRTVEAAAAPTASAMAPRTPSSPNGWPSCLRRSSTRSASNSRRSPGQRGVLDDDASADCLLAAKEPDLGRRTNLRHLHGDLRDHRGRVDRRRARHLPYNVARRRTTSTDRAAARLARLGARSRPHRSLPTATRAVGPDVAGLSGVIAVTLAGGANACRTRPSLRS
jgi:hypothetical protein